MSAERREGRERVVVVGLGPAGVDLLLPVARRALEDAAVRFVRTERHPAVAELRAEGLELTALDHHYEDAPDLDEAYEGIAGEVLAAVREHGSVAYAVPGSPGTAERTVALLRERGAEVGLVPGLSFAELAWARLGVDAMGGARVLDGRSLGRADVVAGGPVLVAQCDAPAVLSDVKLVLLEALPPDAEVVVLQRLGTPDEAVVRLPLEELDRDVVADHLTSVFADLGDGPADELARFVALVERLRGPGGCPWDAEQTHHSLTRHLVEEAYEVVDAIEALPPDAPGGDTPVPAEAYGLLEEELGDLAVQLVFHATLAREAGAFTLAEVLAGVREKLVRRHPHVFGSVEVEGADDVMRNWEQIKRQEKREKREKRDKREQREQREQRDGSAEADGPDEPASALDDVPASLPALLYARKLLGKAAAAGLPMMSPEEALAAVADAGRRLADGPPSEVERRAGELLAALVLFARERGFDAETALRGWARRFREHFRAVEERAAEDGLDLASATPDEISALWIETSTPSP